MNLIYSIISYPWCILGTLEFNIFYKIIIQMLWVKENLQESWSLVFRWMDLSDWLSFRWVIFIWFKYTLIIWTRFLNFLIFFSVHLSQLLVLEQQEMILVVYVQLFASGRTLAMLTWNQLRKKILQVWKHADGMMISGRKLVWGILWKAIMQKLVKNLNN